MAKGFPQKIVKIFELQPKMTLSWNDSKDLKTQSFIKLTTKKKLLHSLKFYLKSDKPLSGSHPQTVKFFYLLSKRIKISPRNKAAVRGRGNNMFFGIVLVEVYFLYEEGKSLKKEKEKKNNPSFTVGITLFSIYHMFPWATDYSTGSKQYLKCDLNHKAIN